MSDFNSSTASGYQHSGIEATTGPLANSRDIVSFIRDAIEDGRFRADEVLPSTRDLAAQLGVSRFAVLKAYEMLMEQGYVQTVKGSGTFVRRRSFNDMTNSAAVADGVNQQLVDSSLVRVTPECLTRGPILSEGGFGNVFGLPTRAWQKALHNLSGNGMMVVGGSDMAGESSLREEIARYVRRARGLVCSPSQVFVFPSKYYALEMIAKLLPVSGEQVAVEAMSDPRVRAIFRLNGAEIVLADSMEPGTDSRVLYLTPSNGCPLGNGWSGNQQACMLELVKQPRCFFIEDDNGSEYRHDMTIEAPVVTKAPGNGIFLSDFSRSLAPLSSLSYVIVPMPLVERFSALIASGIWTVNRIEQLALAEILSTGQLERTIRRQRVLLTELRRVVTQQLTRCCGSGVIIGRQPADLHLIIQFPAAVEDIELAAVNSGLKLCSLRAYATDPHATTRFFALPLLQAPLEELGSVIANFGRQLITKQQGTQSVAERAIGMPGAIDKDK